MKTAKPLHYAANGRHTTACGQRCEPNHKNNEKEHGEATPRCKKCLAVLKKAEELDAAALVICSQDASTDALSHCLRAKVEGELLRKKLPDPSMWKVVVWRDLVWHYKVESGPMAIHEHKYGEKVSYQLYIANRCFNSESPTKVLENAHKSLQIAINELVELQCGVFAALKEAE